MIESIKFYFWKFIVNQIPDLVIDEIFYRYYSMHYPMEEGEPDE